MGCVVVTVFSQSLIKLFLKPKADEVESNNEETQNIESATAICNSVLFLAIFGKFFDLWQVMLQGAVRALAIQKRSANFNLVAYWGINLPLSITLAFYLDIGYIGLWYSIIMAQIFLAFAVTYIIETTDWQQVADKS